jgi:hypothetical protein
MCFFLIYSVLNLTKFKIGTYPTHLLSSLLAFLISGTMSIIFNIYTFFISRGNISTTYTQNHSRETKPTTAQTLRGRIVGLSCFAESIVEGGGGGHQWHKTEKQKGLS